MVHPTVEAIPLIALMVPYIGGLLAALINGARVSGYLVFLFNYYTLWYWLIVGFMYLSWLWVFEAWGLLDMGWFWQIFSPLDKDGNYSIVDEWVELNTWTMAYTAKVIEIESGKPWDAKNPQHIQMMKDYTWGYVFEHSMMVYLI